MKNNRKHFDVPMGSFHGAEICEIVGLLLLNKLNTIPTFEKNGLYRDDGLAVVSDLNGSMYERLSKPVLLNRG